MVNVRDIVLSSGGIQVGTRTPDVSAAELAGVAVDLVQGIQAEKDSRDAAAFNIEAQTDLQLFGVQALEQARVNSERPDDITKNFLEIYENRYQELKRKAPNSTAQQQLQESYQSLRASLGASAMGVQVSEAQSFRKTAVLNARDANRNALLGGIIDYNTAKANDISINSQIDSFISSSEAAIMRRQARHDTAAVRWQSRPIVEQYGIWSGASVKGKGTFSEAQELVFANEGGFTPIDGASGEPAIFGINRKWHKEAFDRIKSITENKGVEAGKRAAAEYYKKEFWDKNDIGSLPAATRAIVYDGAVNHHAGFVKRLIDSARGGATPEQLIDMREKEYRRLGEGFPDKHGASLNGWLNRLDNVEAATFGATGTEFDDLSLNDKMEAAKQMQAFEIDMRGKEDSDPGAFREVVGLSDEESIARQGGKKRAVLLPNDTAKTIVAEANNLESVDDVFAMAQQLKERGGDNYDLVMRDLRRQKLNPRVESAINLANEDAATYKEHIELFMDSYQLDKSGNDDTTLDKAFKRVGQNKTSFISSWSSETEDLRELMVREGVDSNHIEAELMAYEKLAMMHVVKYGDVGNAIEFALAPLLDRHNKISLGGVDVRVPRRLKSANPDDPGITLNADIMEERLGFAYADLLQEISKDKEKDGEFFDVDSVVPTLNADESGIILRDLLGTPVVDANNRPYEINFRDMLTQEFSIEALRRIREELSKLPFGERDKRRKELFGISDEPFDPHKRR